MEIEPIDVLTAVLRVMPAIAPVAAMALALIVWLRLLALGQWLRERGRERYALYADFVITNAGILGALFVSAWTAEQLGGAPVANLLADLRLTGGAETNLLAGATVGLLATYFAIAALSERVSVLLGEHESPFAAAMRPQTVGERFVWVSVMSPAAGFCEEVIFRGVLLSIAFTFGADAVIAVALTSLAFGLGHAVYGLTWTIGTTLLGAVSAVSVLACDSLWPAIVAHTIYDMTVYYVFDTARLEETPDDGVHAPARTLRGLTPLR
ncbi:MAG: CPBP family intramembrane metalloprotease [Alphaproteobacteria bacterium]|nr:CPBP family intramembrane metalloprotease [Alphaproteobacteria bacterium]